MNQQNQKVLVIGAGLAGSEAAWFLANKGVAVVLCESKTVNPNPAQKVKTFAELVCTNSLKSVKPDTGHGVLKYEMRKLNSLVLEVGEETKVPAGDALAVDRDKFSALITERLKSHPLIKVVDEDVADPIKAMEQYVCSYVIIATGPLTTISMEKWMVDNLAKDNLYFYDAIAPVVDADSLDYSKLYFKDRHKPVDPEAAEEADYLNAPMNKEQYEKFIAELCQAEKVEAKDFEEYKFFESCLPVDIMAERGVDTARFSCMKPIGLEMADGSMPYACVQLRRENLQGSAYNLVGFQTRLKYPEQKRVFRLIPGLENASFLHLGSVHRNTFLNARKILTLDMASREFPRMHFAGQMTGVEGYTESASSGLYVAWQVWQKICGKGPVKWPIDTGIGALINYVMTASTPAPSNINFGLLPQVELTKEQRKNRKNRKKVKKELASERARNSFEAFMSENEVIK